jgi:hypothetical protein
MSRESWSPRIGEVSLHPRKGRAFRHGDQGGGGGMTAHAALRPRDPMHLGVSSSPRLSNTPERSPVSAASLGLTMPHPCAADGRQHRDGGMTRRQGPGERVGNTPARFLLAPSAAGVVGRTGTSLRPATRRTLATTKIPRLWLPISRMVTP